MLFSILVGILSVFCFACGFVALRDGDMSARLKLSVSGFYFTLSLFLALASRFI